MDIVHINKRNYISTKDAKKVLGDCSNTTLFNLINHHKAFQTRRLGSAVLVEVTSFKKYCKEKRGIKVTI